jgi:elongation factor G
MKREFGAEVDTGVPQVAYREAISLRATFDYTHKKQTGGAGQYGRVAGFMEPMDEGGFEFVNRIKGGAIPTQFVLAVEKGFRSCLKKGPLAGFPVVGLRVTINDGQSHSVDSSDRAFHEAAFGAFRQAYSKAAPMLIEPLMKVVVECPSEFQGSVLASFGQRRGRIVSAAEYGVFATIEAEVPLETMFGYSTTLRSMTQGKGEFTMEFSRYAKAPESFAEEVKKRREKGGKN